MKAKYITRQFSRFNGLALAVLGAIGIGVAAMPLRADVLINDSAEILSGAPASWNSTTDVVIAYNSGKVGMVTLTNTTGITTVLVHDTYISNIAKRSCVSS